MVIVHLLDYEADVDEEDLRGEPGYTGCDYDYYN